MLAIFIEVLVEYTMAMSGKLCTHIFQRTLWLSLAALSCANFFAQPADSAPESTLAIPSGTILPVRLNSTISSTNCKPGQAITGRVMQSVPLAQGAAIKEGSKVLGQIVAVTPANAGTPAHTTIQFDKLISSHQTIPITTNLRAIAGVVRLDEAQIPTLGSGESEVYSWLTTVQIGGDVVYGDGGPVIAGDRSHQVVGKRVGGGVLGLVRAKEGAECRGAVDGNDSPQALWLFSSDACGVYGLEHVSIAHAGRSNPIGLITLASDHGKLKVPAGAGMLLRIIAASDK